MKFYKEPEPMECLAGDTLPEFHIKVIGAASQTGLTLLLRVIPVSNPDSIACTKYGTASENGFTVQLNGADTMHLKGAYYLDFIVEDNTAAKHKKIRGVLVVHRSGKGA